MMAIRTTQSVMLMALIGVLLAGSVVNADESAKLLRDDYVISGVDGKLLLTDDGKRLFEFETDLSDGKSTLKSGEPVELLKSATLENIIEDSRQRGDLRYRLWGKITQFEGKNFIFVSYFLPLRKPEDRRQHTANTEQTAENKGQMINAPNDVLTIPDGIVAKLQTSEVIPADEKQERLQLKQDSIFANRTGFIIGDKGRLSFKPDGLGRGIDNFTIELLPCGALEDAVAEIGTETDRVRFNIAGILTTYEGKQYLLLQKATRIYSYGNFGR